MATDKFVVKNGLLVGTNTDDGVNLVQVNGTISATNLLYSGTISGDGSGLTNVNATTLDSVDSTQFLRSDAADTKTSGNLSFSDNVRAVFGTGSDLQIWYDGTNGYIRGINSGTLNIQCNGGSRINLGDEFGNNLVVVNDNADVVLYYGTTPSQKLATTATGITVTGSVTASEIIAASTDLDITGNAIISGNLTVNGTTTSLNTTTVTTEDSVIVLNSGQTTPANDIGLILQRYSSPTTTNYNVAIAWDEGSDRLMFGATAETGADADITVSSEWMTITGAGNVGIGVTNPAFTSGTGLEIQRSGTATLRLDSGTFATELRGTTTGTQLLQLSAGFLDLGTSGTPRIRIASNGNVGIGTLSPVTGLHYQPVVGTGWTGTLASTSSYEPTTSELGIYGQKGSAGVAGDYVGIRFTINGNGSGIASAGIFGVREAAEGDGDTAIVFTTRQNTANNTEKIRITSAGNLGIGTNNPVSALDVTGTVTADGLLIEGASSGTVTAATFTNITNAAGTRVQAVLQNVNSSCNINLVSERTGANFGADFVIETSDEIDGTDRQRLRVAENGDISFYDSTGTTRKFFWDASTERLGIDNVAPNAKLVVGPSAGVTSEGLVASFYSGNDTAVSILSNTNNNGAGPRLRLFENNPNRFGTELFYDSGLNSFSIVNYSNNVETGRIHMLGSGNVGIGTTNPSTKLVVRDTNSTIQSVGTAGYGSFYAFSSGTNSSYMFFANASSGDTGRITSNNDGSMAFSNTASNTERMRISGTGNVGIGTTNPSTRLQVAASSNVTTDYPFTINNSANNYGLQIGAYGMSNVSYGAVGVDFTFSFGDDVVFSLGSSGQLRAESGTPQFILKDTDSVGVAATPFVEFEQSDGGRLGIVGYASASNGNLMIIQDSANPITFDINGSERMRLDSNGQFKLGGSSLTNSFFSLQGTPTLTTTGGIAVRNDVTYDLTVSTASVTGFNNTHDLGATGSTINAYGFKDNSLGSFGGTATNYYSFHASNQTVATNNYGYWSGLTNAAGRWNFYASGDAPNYFAGNVGIGITNPSTALQVNGTVTATAFSGNITGTASNANLLDNLDSTQFLRSDAADTATGVVTFSDRIQAHEIRTDTNQELILNAGEAYLYATGQTDEFVYVNAESGLQINTSPDNWTTGWAARVTTTIDSTGITWNGNTVWHAGNDGSGSGLDADTVDGIQAASFLRSDAADTATGTITFSGGAQLSVQSSTGTLNHALETSASVATYRTDATYWRLWQPNSQEQIVAYDNGLVALAFDGTRKLQTRTEGLDVYGNIYLTGTATTTNQARTIHFTGFDKETVGDVSDAAYIRHTINVGGHTGSVLEFSSQNDVQDGIAFQTNGSSPLKHNSKNIPRIGVSDAPPGATNIVGDLWWDSNQGSMHIYYGSAWVEVNPYLGTTANPQFNSLGVGTPASGTTGEIRATNDVTAYYSDARLKTFEGTIDNAVDKVKQLNGYYFRENKIAKTLGYNNPDRQVGVSAQEVQTVLPEVVVAAPISDEYLTVKYEKMVPLLIEAIKEQQEMIDELRKEIENLKGKV